MFFNFISEGFQMGSGKAQREKFSKITSGGYRISEVDRFFKKVALRIDKGESNLLSSELEAVRFTITKRTGYTPKEVDDRLDSLARTYIGKVGSSKLGTKSSERSSFSREGSRKSHFSFLQSKEDWFSFSSGSLLLPRSRRFVWRSSYGVLRTFCATASSTLCPLWCLCPFAWFLS